MRLPARMIVDLVRARVAAAGGTATVLQRGDADAGAIILVADGARTASGSASAPVSGDPLSGEFATTAWEWRTPFDGPARFERVTLAPVPADRPAPHPFAPDAGAAAVLAWAAQRMAGDSDLWALELTVPDAPRLIATLVGPD